MNTYMPFIASVTRFLIAGGSGTLLYFVILYGLTEYAHAWYIASAIVAFVAASTWNFLLHKYRTFRNTDRHRIHRQAAQYGKLVSTMFLVNVSVLYALVEYGGLWYLLAQIFVTAVLTIPSFLISRRIFAT